MRDFMLGNVIARSTVGLFLILIFSGPVSAGIVIDDFNATRSYPTCCGEYGTYWAFDSNVVQNGSGTLVVGGTASDNGGFYRDKRGEVLWNFTAQSNLVLRAKVLAGNQATNFYLVFRDATGNRALYTFPFSELNSSNFTVLSKSLFTPDWTDGAPFDFTRVISMDIYGEFTEVDSPLRLELDSIETQGPSVIGMLHLDYRTTNGVLVLSWSTNLTNGFLLQSAPTVLGGWGNEINVVIVSNEYRFAVLTTNETRFYRLLATSDPLGGYPVMDEEEFWASLPSPDSLMMRNEANLARSEPVLTDFPFFPAMPPMPPMPDERLGLAANRAMVSEMQASAMNSGVPPPPSGLIIPTTSYLEVAAYSVFITNTWFLNDTNPTDYEKSYSLTYSPSSGGTQYYNQISYTSHVASTTYPYPWLRTSGSFMEEEETTTWDLMSPYWPNGVEIMTQPHRRTNNSMEPPLILYYKFGGLSGSILGGTTNAVPNYYGSFESITRKQDVQMNLHVGQSFSNNWRTFVLLTNTAERIDSMDVPWFGEWHGWMCDVYYDQSSPISCGDITVLGQGLNIDNRLFVQLVPGTITNVTPAITGAPNYFFNLQVVPHKVVPLTRIYHQFFTRAIPLFITNKPPILADLQSCFNGGSMLLATDNDTRIPDDDPTVVFSINDASLYRTDDVPVYVEFQISDGPTSYCLFTRTGLPVFDRYFGTNRASKYFDVVNQLDLHELGNYTAANIKQVNSITIGGNGANGFGPKGYPPSIVLAESGLNNVTPVHEWGHNCGLDHRGLPQNPGKVFEAIMGDWVLTITNFPRTKINRFERAVINTNLNSYYP